MSTEIKRYRLLKDLPYVKAGAIYQLDEGDTYVCDTETAQFTDGTKWDGLGKCAVENAAEGWFELIPEQSMPKQEERIQVCVTAIGDSDKELMVFGTRKFDLNKLTEIKDAIENALNPTTEVDKILDIDEAKHVEYWYNEFKVASKSLGEWIEKYCKLEKENEELKATYTEQTKSDILFTTEQYKEIWDMIFSQTGFPPNHPKTKRNK